ncbi:MAG: aspartoacylase [Spirulinaceae cyanobacterium]
MVNINRVAVVGGTHGNEFTGVYLVKKFTHFPELIHRKSFQTEAILANPGAFQAARRYLDKDLNRCFITRDLHNPTLRTYEEKRAKTIYQTIGFQGSSQADFILDLHSSSANMGLTIILVNDHPFNLRLAAYLSLIEPTVKIYYWTEKKQENPFLNSLCELGFTLELGPIAPKTLKATIFQKTENLVYRILDYLDKYNQGLLPTPEQELTIYQHFKTIDYPKNEAGGIRAMIHPQLENRDYQKLQPGDPLFLTFEGETIFYQDEESVWPLFINEVAYYEKEIAMCLAKETKIKIPEYSNF